MGRQISGSLLAATALVMTVFFAGCGSNSTTDDVLAKWNGGQITRTDFREIWKVKFPTEGDQVDDDALFQRFQLRALAIGKLAQADAKSSGLDKSDEFLTATSIAAQQAQLQAFTDKKTSEPIGTPAMPMMEIQFSFLRDPEGTLDRRSEAVKHARKLNAIKNDSQAVDRLIDRSTDRKIFRASAGYLPPQCVNCAANQTPYLIGPLRDKPFGEFVVVDHPTGRWVARKLAAPSVKRSDLHAYFTKFFTKQAALVKAYIATLKSAKEKKYFSSNYSLDQAGVEQQAKTYTDQIKDVERESRVTSLIDELKRKYKFVQHPAGRWKGRVERGIKYSDGTKLFSLGGDDFTFGDLEDAMPDGVLSLKEKLLNLQVLINHFVLLKDPGYANARSLPKYKLFLQSRIENAHSEAFYAMHVPDIKVTTVDLRRRFEQGKDSEYKGTTLSEARDRIRAAIVNERQAPDRHRAEQELIEKYGLVLHEDKLKPGSI